MSDCVQQLALAQAALLKAQQELETATRARQSAEAEQRRLQHELEQFAYIVSHDLQAPLRNIAGFSQLLEKRCRDRLDGDALEFLDFINRGVRNMQGLILDLLRLSRVGRRDVVPLQALPLEHAVQRARNKLAAAFQKSGARVQMSPLPVVLAEQDLLVQLFEQLIDNSLKFQPRGQVPEITIACQDSGTHWQITVCDNGLGLAAAHHETIFAVFRKLHPPEEYLGNGIGLPIARKIAAYHGGQLNAESAGEGRGSCFRLLLPKSPQVPDPREAVNGAGEPVL